MAKSVACMTAGEINKALDRVDKERSKLVDIFIAEGRGHERYSETAVKTDPLAMRSNRNVEEGRALRNEIARRYGPGAPSRLPRGRSFGPIGGKC